MDRSSITGAKTAFPKTLQAADDRSVSTKTLAAALWEEIPPGTRGVATDKAKVGPALIQVQEELAQKGHIYSVSRLQDLRAVAGWVAEGITLDAKSFPWRNVPFAVHEEARHAKGFTLADLDEMIATNDKVTGDMIRLAVGKRPTRSKSTIEDELAKDPDAISKAAKESPEVAEAVQAAAASDLVDWPEAPAKSRNMGDLYREIEDALGHMLIDMSTAIGLAEEAIQNGWGVGDLEWAALAQTPDLTLQDSFIEFGKLVAMIQIDKERV